MSLALYVSDVGTFSSVIREDNQIAVVVKAAVFFCLISVLK